MRNAKAAWLVVLLAGLALVLSPGCDKKKGGKKDEKGKVTKKDETKKDEAKKDEAKKEEPKKDEAKKDEAKKEEPKGDEPKGDEPKGDEPKKEEAKADGDLPETCAKLLKCYEGMMGKMPEAAQAAYKKSIDAWKSDWKQAPAGGLEQTCKMTWDQTKKAMAANPHWPADCK